MGICAIPPKDKRAFGKAVGSELLRTHGKKPYYSVHEVTQAIQQTAYPIDWSCWAYSLFTAPEDFANYHRSIGEACDYGVMKAEMVSALTDGASSSWFSIDMSWLEWPDIDLSSVFDFFDA